VLVLTGHLLKDPEFTLKFHRGELFAGSGFEQQAPALKPLQRAPIVLDASIDAVLTALRHTETS
jgi:threonine synthase